MRITLVINARDPAETEALRAQVERLREQGHSVDPRLTFEAGDARRMAQEAAAAGAELVVAVGGDGTLNEVANGLHGWLAGGAGRVAPRLGILPWGTANDLAAGLGIPEEAEAALETAVHGAPRPIDVGLVNGHCFLNVSTGGFGAEASEDTPAEAKRALGGLAYLITGARELAGLRAARARFRGEEPIYEGPFLLFAVGNGRRTGGGNWLTPRAELADGLLDLCVVREVSRIEFLALLPELRAGRHLDHPAVIYRQLPALTVETEEELSFNADGEPMGGRRIEYAVSAHRLTVMTPR